MIVSELFDFDEAELLEAKEEKLSGKPVQEPEPEFFSVEDCIAEEYKAKTKDGWDVRIICTDRKSTMPLVGLVGVRYKGEWNDQEGVYCWDSKGKYYKGENYGFDLVNLSRWSLYEEYLKAQKEKEKEERKKRKEEANVDKV